MGLIRGLFPTKVTEQDMGDTYLPPFRSCVREGGASCLMCSYNKVNGVPSCASRELLQLARDDWGLQGCARHLFAGMPDRALLRSLSP